MNYLQRFWHNHRQYTAFLKHPYFRNVWFNIKLILSNLFIIYVLILIGNLRNGEILCSFISFLGILLIVHFYFYFAKHLTYNYIKASRLHIEVREYFEKDM